MRFIARLLTLPKTHIARFAAGSQTRECSLFACLMRFSRPIRLPIAPVLQTLGPRHYGPLPFSANDEGFGENRSLRARNRAKHPGEPLRLRRLERMERAKLANGSAYKPPTGRSSTLLLRDKTDAARSAGQKTARKKAAPRKAKRTRPLRKEMGSKSKSHRLVCRYCGSDDLAPSSIKRRDRRCRKCFSKRYGPAAPARKAKVKK
jgi:hypothetical protein